MKGASSDEIALELGMTKGQIDRIIQSDRKRFPYRCRHADKVVRQRCVTEVNDGMPPKAAARKYGVHVNTVRRWVRDAKARMVDKA